MNEENKQINKGPQIKTPLQTLNDKQAPNILDPKEIRNLEGLIETVSIIPSGYPRKFFDSIKIYINGTTKRLYIYSQGTKTWLYVALT